MDVVRIVYLSPSGKLGGAERSLLDLLASLRAARPDWSLHLITAGDGPLAHRATALGVASTLVPFPESLARLGDAGAGGPAGNRVGRLAFLRRCSSAATTVAPYTVRLFRALRDAAPDLLHTNGFKMHVLGLWARQRGVPVLWHIRDHVVSRPVMARLLRSHALWCAAAVTNSHRVADDVRSVCAGRLKVYPIHDAIDLREFSPSGPVLDLDTPARMRPSDSGSVRVGLLATMARWKGHDVFLRALSLLPANLPIRGYVVGGALYDTEGSECSLVGLRSLAAKLCIAGKVGFVDFVDHPAAAMRALDIVVHASTEPEPFGRVIGEAMACGRAVIASRAAGATELIAAGIDALLYEPGDAAALAERIAILANNPELRAGLGRAGRSAAERCFDRARLAHDLIPIYQTLTSASN